MRATSTHFKLGVLTLLAIIAAVVVIFALGWRGSQSDTVRYHTYFDETVQGLELGSPVKYRGVAIGSVSDIQIAPDNKLVDVTLSIAAADERRLKPATVAHGMRAQLGTQGITGVKFVDIDFFDPKTAPGTELSFTPAEKYIPARPSLLKSLEGNLESVGQRLPDLVEATAVTLHSIDVILVDLGAQNLPPKLASTIEHVDAAVGELRRVLQHLDGAHLPEKLGASIEHFDTAIARVTALLEAVGQDGGLVASTQRATDSIGALGRGVNGSALELQRTLRELGDAAAAIRELAESLERDPDMLLKGRAKAKTR